MSTQDQPIDEYTIAAYMAGTLPPERRAEVAAYLATHEDARELMMMAFDTLSHCDEQTMAYSEETSHGVPRVPIAVNAARAATPPKRVWRHVVVASTAVVALGAVLFILNTPSTDTLRSLPPSPDGRITVEVSTPSIQFHWSSIPEAYSYRIIIFDPEQVETVSQHKTNDTQLLSDDEFMLSLKDKLTPGHIYTFQVEAFDIQNRSLQRSERIHFVTE